MSSRATCAQPRTGYFSCFARMLTVDGGAFHPSGPSFTWPAGINPVTPADLDSAYRLASVTSESTQTVAIVDAFDNPNVAADLAAYRAAYGLPPMSCDASGPCLRVVDQTGGTNLPAADEGWAAEISLDVDAVSAVCPMCNILLVEAHANRTTDMFAAVEEAVALGANVVSMSFGGSETINGSSIWGYDSSFASKDVAFVASSGDSGFGAAEYPASSPDVIAVGGTTLRPANNARGWDESVWSGSGSGCSSVELKPAWQKDLLCPTRMVADVSADGDPGTGLIMYDSFGGKGPWWAGGGTSLSAPIIAGLIARGGGNHGRAGASAFYDNAGLNDIVRGTNYNVPATSATQMQRCPVYLCAAAAGYDGPSGVGTPRGGP